MAMASDINGVQAGQSSNAAATAVNFLRTKLRQRRLYRETVRELSAMGNRDLADLGLSRSMIRSVAREAAQAV